MKTFKVRNWKLSKNIIATRKISMFLPYRYCCWSQESNEPVAFIKNPFYGGNMNKYTITDTEGNEYIVWACTKEEALHEFIRSLSDDMGISTDVTIR